jgi:hypothetical protein
VSVPVTPRERAWIELSELFRDTEITAEGVGAIARELRAQGFDEAVAGRILEEEVAPVFGWNLLSVAGNWTGWKEEDVVALVREWLARREARTLAGAMRRTALAGWVRRKLFCSIVQRKWREVAEAMHSAPPLL